MQNKQKALAVIQSCYVLIRHLFNLKKEEEGGGEAIMYRYLQGWKYTRSVECCILQILSSIMETGKSHTHTHAHTRTSRPETRGQCYRGEHSPAQLSFRGNTHEGLCWWQDEDTHRYVKSLPHPTILSRLIPGQTKKIKMQFLVHGGNATVIGGSHGA